MLCLLTQAEILIHDLRGGTVGYSEVCGCCSNRTKQDKSKSL